MAEVLINLKNDDHESMELAKYDFVKMNITESITLDQVNKGILKLQQELANDIDEYERLTRRLETLVKILSIKKHTDLKFQEDISLE